jgi:hypothetical protein
MNEPTSTNLQSSCLLDLVVMVIVVVVVMVLVRPLFFSRQVSVSGLMEIEKREEATVY